MIVLYITINAKYFSEKFSFFSFKNFKNWFSFYMLLFLTQTSKHTQKFN